jgi:hypothetical protein
MFALSDDTMLVFLSDTHIPGAEGTGIFGSRDGRAWRP